MKKENIVLIVIAAVVIAFGAGRLSKTMNSSPAGAPAQPATVGEAAPAAAAGANTNGIPASMPWKGAANGMVTILEVSDFQCPFCSRVGPTIKQIIEAYPNDVKIVWANQPLPFHNNAKPAAIAALAAHKQGKFWEMHDKLFANQQQLSPENYEKWAKEIGLDVAKFKADLSDAAIAKQIDKEQASANATGAGGTPSFFINGKLIQGAQPFEEFKKAIDAALADAKAVSAGKSGLEQIKLAATKTGGDTGTKVVEYFLEGKAPAAEAAPAKREEAKADEGPATPPPDSYDVWKVPVDPKRDSVKGDNDKALITIVEISDFQCPFCSRGANTLTEVEKAYGDKVRFVFKHHPLPFHKDARPASAAAIAAGKQGKFWQFHDKAFANQQALTEDNFVAWAKEIGLDMAKFDAVRKDPATDKMISEDMDMAGTVGVRGTPGFFINGRKIVGAQPLPMFKAVIDEELKKAEAAGKKGQALYDDIVAKGKVFSELNDKVNDFNVEGLPFKGKKDAPITIVEFSDFQCPYCSRIAEPVKAVMEANPDKVKVVFAHFPLPFHQMAKPASVAAQLAFDQGGPDLFWKVHDALFAAQRELSEDKIKEIATGAGVDKAKLEEALKGDKYAGLFKKIQEMGEKDGVEGTPSLYINGRKFEPSAGYAPESFAKAFALLKK
ncbi:MAG: thioredoxin domain-containing protein [Deltaproteobacteria bacterium]|nr:thioredoxin domain-containing protein [Deltaproteobacteria bacterium]